MNTNQTHKHINEKKFVIITYHYIGFTFSISNQQFNYSRYLRFINIIIHVYYLNIAYLRNYKLFVGPL